MRVVEEIQVDNKPLHYELLIRSASGIYSPILIDDITLEQERKGAPSKLTFTVVKDDTVSFAHGNQVQLKVNDVGVFMGFVFDKSRDKKQHIKVTAYDQLRYFKNKFSYVFTNKKASDIIRTVAKDFGLQVGKIEDTGCVIPKRIEKDKTLFDIVQNALDVTLVQTGKLFVLYDNFGKLELKNFEKMEVGLSVDSETAQDFDYSSSIDGAYNKVLLVRENKKTNKREVFESDGDTNIAEWGLLLYYDTVQEGVDGQTRANQICDIKNRVQRDLTVKGCFGDTSVRAGSSVKVRLHIGDKIIDNKRLLCERVTHYFRNDYHTMDLTLMGNNFLYADGGI